MYAGPQQALQRRATEPAYEREYGSDEEYVPHAARGKALPSPAQDLEAKEKAQDTAPAGGRLAPQDSGHSVESGPQHRDSNPAFRDPIDFKPGEGLYKPPVWLDEFENATVGTLGGTLLDLTDDQTAGDDKKKAWWESDGRGKNSSYSSRPRKAEAFDGEYDDAGKLRFCLPCSACPTQGSRQTNSFPRINAFQTAIVPSLRTSVEILRYPTRKGSH